MGDGHGGSLDAGARKALHAGLVKRLGAGRETAGEMPETDITTKLCRSFGLGQDRRIDPAACADSRDTSDRGLLDDLTSTLSRPNKSSVRQFTVPLLT
jgi:hypothetical protein